jgi:hypothetical protein
MVLWPTPSARTCNSTPDQAEFWIRLTKSENWPIAIKISCYDSAPQKYLRIRTSPK